MAIVFQMNGFDHEIWQALLSDWPFESFHDEDNRITGYVQDHDITRQLMGFIEENKGIYFLDFELNEVEQKNWNEVWESSFNPVAVDHYCYIRADFHGYPDEPFRHIINISPKMAFGTGHHATTYMMLQAMAKIECKDKTVLDFGCGTGILSIVAAREKASSVTGIDIQTEAIENCNEHAAMNEVEGDCEFLLGGLEMVSGNEYDIILANINRNVILHHLADLAKLSKGNGFILISGVMFDDESVIRPAFESAGFQLKEKREKDQWLQMTWTGRPD